MNSYGLTLSDGMSWEFTTSDPDLRSWLGDFASILRLSNRCSQPARRVVVVNADKHAAGKAPGELLLAWNASGDRDVVCAFSAARLREPEFSILLMQECLGRISDEAILAGALPFHATLLEHSGRCVLLAAAGGTGKSTCARRAPKPWHARSDDAALAARTSDGGYQAHPFPTWMDHIWRGQKTTWPVQHHFALAGVFFLEQAGEDAVMPLGQGEAVVRILQSARQSLGYFWEQMPVEQKRRLHMAVLHNATAMSKTLPSFRLQATLHGCFWKKIEQALDAITKQAS